MVEDHLSERVWRGLDSIEFMTFIHASPPRISCSEHGILEGVMPWTEKTSVFTLRFETGSIRMLQNMDTYNFTEIMHVSARRHVTSLREHWRRVRTERRESSVLGIDEKSYKKGHRYITPVYDMTNNGVDYISYERKKKSLDEYYETLSREELANIKAVSMDMWDPIMSSTMEHVPDASTKVLFNRFHVMRHVNEAVDKTMKEENRKLKEKGIMDLNGTRYIWLYSSENLPERYRETYNELRKADLLTGKAYSMKENVRNLWNMPTPEEGSKYWDSWYSWSFIDQWMQ